MDRTGHNGPMVKRLNRAAVLDCLWRRGPTRRVDIAGMTRLTAATITNLTGELLEEGLLVAAAPGADDAGTRGRGVALAVNAAARTVIAVHLQSDRVELATVDLGGSVTDTAEFRFDPGLPPDRLLDELAAACARQVDRAPAPVVGVGVASAGQVDARTGRIARFPATGWSDVPVVEALQRALRLPVVLDHNVRGMAVAETTLGEHRAASDLLFLYVGRGVGAGVISGGDLFRGRSGAAAEVGHTAIMADGPLCWCGSRGCLELFTSELALVRHAEAVLGALPGADPLAALLARTDDTATRLLVTAGRHLGLALGNAVTLFDVRTVVLGGRLFDSAIVTAAVAEAVEGRYFDPGAQPVRLSRTGFGARVGLVGAAALALVALVFRPDPARATPAPDRVLLP